MEIVKTDAIPLRSIKHSESSRIIRFYTERGGKVSVLAKGIRRSKQQVPTDTFSLMSIIYRSKPSREIQILTGAELLNPFLGIRDDFRKSAAAFAICEVVDKTTEVSDPNPALFEAMVEALKGLDSAKSNPLNYLWFFLLRLTEAQGFGLNLDTCLNCGKRLKELPAGKLQFSYARGGVFCPECGGEESSIKITPESLKVLQYLKAKGADKLDRLKTSPASAREIGKILFGFLRYHIEGLQYLKSLEMIYK